LKLIFFLLKESRIPIILAIFFGVLSGGSGAYLIKIVHTVVENIETTGGDLVFVFLGVLVLFIISNFGSMLPIFKLSEDSLFRMRLHMVQGIINTRTRTLEKVGQARIFASLTDDLNTLADGLNMVPTLIINTLVLLFCGIYLGSLDWRVLAATVAASVILAFLLQKGMNRAFGYYAAARDTEDNLYQHYKAVTEGNKELKLHLTRARSFMEKLLIPTIDEYRRNRIKGANALAVGISFTNALFFMIIGVLIFLLPHIFLVPREVITGAVLIFIFCMSPVGRLLDMMPMLTRATISLKKVAALNLEDEVNFHFDGKEELFTVPATWRSIEMDGVTHSYYNEQADESFTLGPIQLKLEPGELVYLVGGNGSGKSTLAKILVGLYEPEQGVIRWDDQALGTDNRLSYRQLFSTVFADFYLFEHFLGLEESATFQHVNRYLKELHLDQKVKVVDNRLSTVELSTGQRKRLALLVSYLEDRPIYMFDEWASDQDPVFKEVFYKEILPDLKRRGKTVITISHDDRYFHLADRVIRLDSGRLVEYTEQK